MCVNRRVRLVNIQKKILIFRYLLSLVWFFRGSFTPMTYDNNIIADKRVRFIIILLYRYTIYIRINNNKYRCLFIPTYNVYRNIGQLCVMHTIPTAVVSLHIFHVYSRNHTENIINCLPVKTQ